MAALGGDSGMFAPLSSASLAQTLEVFLLQRESIARVAGMRPAGNGSGEYGAFDTLSEGVIEWRCRGMY